MLVLVIGGVSFYSVRKTDDLLDLGVNGHVRCAVGNAYSLQEGLGEQFAPMLQPVLDAAGREYTLASAHRCDIDGRSYVAIVLRRDRTLVSAILTRRSEQEVFPRALAARTVHAPGIQLHEGRRNGYSVTAFETGPYLGCIVSALPEQLNSELAARVAPVMDRYTKP